MWELARERRILYNGLIFSGYFPHSKGGPIVRDSAVSIVRRLRNAGYEALFAGGCVRDIVMGHAPKDYDIATDAPPERVDELFDKTRAVGAAFGVMLVTLNNTTFEVATFRTEAEYRDGRHPEKVAFATAKEDARRRDFTINGMFYDPLEEKIIDYVGGKDDIGRGLVRTIGNPEDRFAEDKLRLLRAIRFAARYEYEIENDTWQALLRMSPQITSVSAERSRDELYQIFSGTHPGRGMDLLQQSMMRYILPEIYCLEGIRQPPNFHPEGDVYIHTKLMLEALESKEEDLVFAVLFHDVGKPPTYEVRDRITFYGHVQVGVALAEDICCRLRCSNELTDGVKDLVAQHLRFIDVPKMRQSTLRRFLSQDNFAKHMELHRVDCLASHGDLSTYDFCNVKLKEYRLERKALRPEPLISGDDLISMGLEPSPIFAKILKRVEDAQLEEEIATKEEAKKLVRQEFKQVFSPRRKKENES